MSRYCWSHDNYRPAMSFEDIGARLGMTKQRVYDEYQRALKKLRQQPEAMQLLAAVVIQQQAEFMVNIPARRLREEAVDASELSFIPEMTHTRRWTVGRRSGGIS